VAPYPESVAELNPTYLRLWTGRQMIRADGMSISEKLKKEGDKMDKAQKEELET